MSRFRTIGIQYFDDAGDPLIGGKLNFYEPGQQSEESRKNTYADVNQTIPNANPVLLTAAGRQPNIFFSGSARSVLTDRDDVQIEVRDPVGGDATDGSFSNWNSDAVYNVPDIVVGTDLLFYISLTDGNEGNDPVGGSADWTQIRFIRVWNIEETYTVGQITEGSDGLLYSSTANNNTGNDPTGDSINWKPASAALVAPVVRAAGKTYAYRNF